MLHNDASWTIGLEAVGAHGEPPLLPTDITGIVELERVPMTREELANSAADRSGDRGAHGTADVEVVGSDAGALGIAAVGFGERTPGLVGGNDLTGLVEHCDVPGQGVER